jgi:hypothetical protein
MKRRTVVLAGILAALVVYASSAVADEKVALRLSRNIMNSPGYVTARVTIERNQNNRGLEVVVESPIFYRSSFVALDGDRAPRVTEITFKSLPVGEYVVAAVLHDGLGRQTMARATAIVLSRGEP